MLRQRQGQEKDDGDGVVSEENFLRYRLQIVQRMPDGPLKAAIASAIATRAGAAATERAKQQKGLSVEVGFDVIGFLRLQSPRR